MVMKAGATRVLSDIRSDIYKSAVMDCASLCNAIADSVSASMGGTSGALIELMLRAMAAYFSSGQENLSWAKALDKGVGAMQFYGGATVGMRTMLDALVPAVQTLNSPVGSVAAAAAAAETGMESTKSMPSLAGRSNYIQEEKLKGIPDPGAVAVSACFQAVAALF